MSLPRGVHPLARPELDRGPLDPARRIANLSLAFRLSPAQLADREALKRALLDPASPSYHRWLSPEEYAARFGARPADVDRASSWLASHGLEVQGASRLGSRLTFSGTVANIEAAFRAPMHRFEVGGGMHYAMTSPPQVPADLADVVLDVTHTHDFFGQPVPEYTHATSTGFAPPDWANVYDVAPAYTTGVGGKVLTGTGVTIAVVGLAPIAQSDVDAWRSTFGLPASTVTMKLVPNTGAGQSGNGAAIAGVIQVEWAGGIAPGATVDYVYTGADDQNPDDAAYYAIENNLAQVLSQAGGTCESVAVSAGFSNSDQSIVDVYASAANILGITYLAPAGDEGATGCLGYGYGGLYVNMPASYPGVTAVGGTAFATGSLTTGGNGYFTAYSAAEEVWEDTNDELAGVAATGGGISSLFSRPDYQGAVPTCTIVGSLPVSGVVAASMRQLPDVAFTAGGSTAATIPSFFECTLSGSDCTTAGGTPTLNTASGTTFSVSAFAGVVALMDQLAGGPLGNINPLLYGLQTSTPSAFHDITTGNDEVTCDPGSDPGCPAGSLYGYAASAGYDCASGLGSVDALNLLTAMLAHAPTTVTVAATPPATSAGTPVALTATVAVPAPNGSAVGGNVAFVFQSYTATGAPDLSWTIGTSTITGGLVNSGTATLAAPIPPGLVRPGMQYVDVYAEYEGDPAHLPSHSANARITFSPTALSISPATASIGTTTNLKFTATGGTTPITWFVRHDSTCDPSGNCSSIDQTSGDFFSGPLAGSVVVGALDANGVEQIADVTVGSTDAGSPDAAAESGVEAGTDAGTEAGTRPDAAADASPVADAAMPPMDGATADAAGDSQGPGSPDASADGGEDAGGDAAPSSGGSGGGSGCGCIVVSRNGSLGAPAAGSLSLLAIAAVVTRRRRRRGA